MGEVLGCHYFKSIKPLHKKMLIYPGSSYFSSDHADIVGFSSDIVVIMGDNYSTSGNIGPHRYRPIHLSVHTGIVHYGTNNFSNLI